MLPNASNNSDNSSKCKISNCPIYNRWLLAFMIIIIALVALLATYGVMHERHYAATIEKIEAIHKAMHERTIEKTKAPKTTVPEKQASDLDLILRVQEAYEKQFNDMAILFSCVFLVIGVIVPIIASWVSLSRSKYFFESNKEKIDALDQEREAKLKSLENDIEKKRKDLEKELKEKLKVVEKKMEEKFEKAGKAKMHKIAQKEMNKTKK